MPLVRSLGVACSQSRSALDSLPGMSTAPRRSSPRLLVALLFACLGVIAVGLVHRAQPAGAAVPQGEVDPSKSAAKIVTHRKFFTTPTGRIACAYRKHGYGHGPVFTCMARYLEGDPATQRTVEGQKPTGMCKTEFSSEWGGSVNMQHGKVEVMCPSDVQVPEIHSKALAYGTRWSRGGYVCLSRSDALRCSTTSGAHGFRYDRDLLRVW